MISPRCPARGPSLSRSSRRRRSWRQRGGSSSGHRLWTLGTGTWSAGLKRFITLQSVLWFPLSSYSCSHRQRRRREHTVRSRSWLTCRMSSLCRSRYSHWVSGFLAGCQACPEGQCTQILTIKMITLIFTAIWNNNNSPVMTSNDTRSAGQLSAFSWAMTMDKVAASAKLLTSQLLGIILGTVWKKHLFLLQVYVFVINNCNI